jgi:rare lipoprotein A
VPSAEPRSRRGNASSYEVWGQVYYTIDSSEGYDEEGLASWYGEAFAGRPTSSGEIFDPDLLTAAHRSLPLPTWVEVTNLANGLKVVVRLNDRGPFHDTERRIIDLSRAAAERIDLVRAGVARVRIRALRPDELQGRRPA